ncbi:Hydrogen peroxide-inducible gene activator [Candidatus Burkholderia verschuerenii]|uniref:Hydrogen peroxide-inducible gene activator n=1 Tax=Candidatus Burkholderia verschuerenii TaxID=242163 RepID=A0A0L0MID4_9BURK|nr:LysR substrate-binding domain-containing protein [Candidatus Burkholderia verschuerenii]KND61739.1 Hydrogen peroxide-inducible gene activator [Candidatus Burkholderia verschuerenii]
MRFDLTDMRLFLTVIERGSITAGAQAMHLALASASERIAGMEAALGAPLLERNRRGVQATPAGEAFLRHARAILGQVEQMRGELRTYATGLKGRIKLMSNTAALAAFLPPRLTRFLAAYPGLLIDLEERPSFEIVPAVAEGRADLGIVADITDHASLATHVVALDRLVVVAGRAHRISGEREVSFAEIIGEPFVGLADAALEMHLAERASRLGRQIDYRIQMRAIDNVGNMVEAGIGLAILSEVTANLLRRPGLAIVPLSEPWATRRLLLCARAFDALTPHASLLARQLMSDTA